MATRHARSSLPADARAAAPACGGTPSARLLRNRLAIVGGVIVLLLFLLAIFGPFLAPFAVPRSRTCTELIRQRQPAARRRSQPRSPARHR